MKRERSERSATRRFLTSAIVGTCALLIKVAPSLAETFSDNFNTSHDYQFGAGAGSMWTGMENVPAFMGVGVFDANASNAGTLTVEDNGTFDSDGNSSNGISGIGWENGESTAPFLFRSLPAGQDFTATVKVVSQTSGQWSTAGLIARAANSPTPPGTGANHTDENFVTMTSFRIDAANVNEGTTLQKRIEAGSQVNDNNIEINSTGTEPLPLVLKLERVGGGVTYRGWASTDGGATFQFQSRVRPTAGNALRDAAVEMQVGLSYQTFGALPGLAQFDDFTLDAYDPLPAPGAPVLPSNLEIVAERGDVIVSLINNSTPNQGPLQWSLTADASNPAPPPTATTVRVLPAMLPGNQGGQPAAFDALGAPFPGFPANGASNFRWNTNVAMRTGSGNTLPAQPWTPGTYRWTVRATNDWGQASNEMALIVTLNPGAAFTADFDGDGDVDSADLVQWRGDFDLNDLSDADDDGDSDGDDFLAWQRQLGGVPAAAAVPEASTGILLLVGAGLMGSRFAANPSQIIAGRGRSRLWRGLRLSAASPS